MGFVYSFDMSEKIAHFKRMPEYIQSSAECNVVDVIYESFVVTGDQDYLMSRLLAQKGLPRGFYWAAAQAIEKYLKAFLLMNGESVKEFNAHPINELFKVASRIDTSLADLNVLPWPARDAFEAHPGAFDQIVVAGSRGCHCQCSFCSIATFYRSFKGRVWRRRDLDDVFDEIDAVRKISPIKFVLMIDDTFIGPGKIGREQAFEFAEALGRRRTDYFVGTSCRADQVDEELFKELKKAGVRLVFLGIESGNEETLKLYDKQALSSQRILDHISL